MKPFLFFIALLVIAALAAPFFMTVKGKPVMSIDDVIEDSTPDILTKKTQVYRWQDKNGVWQFGEEPPTTGTAAAQAERVDITEKITALGDEWHGNQGRRRAPSPKMPIPGIGGLLQGKELMEEAKTQVGNLNDRNERMSATLKEIGERQ